MKQSHIEARGRSERIGFEKREKEVSFRSQKTTAKSMKAAPHHARELSVREEPYT